MDRIGAILQLLSMLVIIIAFLFVGIYPYIQIHNKPLAEKLEVWYQIAQVLVNNEATKNDKSGTEKKQTATDTLVDQAKQLKMPLNKDVAASLVQSAYDQKQINATTNLFNKPKHD